MIRELSAGKEEIVQVNLIQASLRMKKNQLYINWTSASNSKQNSMK